MVLADGKRPLAATPLNGNCRSDNIGLVEIYFSRGLASSCYEDSKLQILSNVIPGVGLVLRQVRALSSKRLTSIRPGKPVGCIAGI